jgi:AraC-like DNA-binding protein
LTKVYKTSSAAETIALGEEIGRRLKGGDLIAYSGGLGAKKDYDIYHPVSFDKELARKFSQLVEQNYRTIHSVADYASMLNLTPKNLNRKIVTEKQIAPNTIIKNRIILQAKRLLVNTTLSIKEIAVYLGYEDYSYFVRFFKSQTGSSPLTFRNSM